MMRRLTLLAVSAVAAIAAGALFAGTASATSVDGQSTGGQLVCDPRVSLCGVAPLNLQDWGGFDTGGGGNSSTGYHCNNVLYVGRPEAYGTRGGTAYYTVGDPTLNTDPNSGDGTHAGEGDCSTTPGDQSSKDANSVVLLRFVYYANVAGQATPACGGNNPDCASDRSAGYIGLLSGDESVAGVPVDLDAGGWGDIDPTR